MNNVAFIGSGGQGRISLSLAYAEWQRKEIIHLANSAEDSEPLIGFVNELRIESDGWAMIAPLGDYPNTAVVMKADGTLKKFRAIQRLDSESATEMVNTFKSSKTKRY